MYVFSFMFVFLRRLFCIHFTSLVMLTFKFLLLLFTFPHYFFFLFFISVFSFSFSFLSRYTHIHCFRFLIIHLFPSLPLPSSSSLPFFSSPPPYSSSCFLSSPLSVSPFRNSQFFFFLIPSLLSFLPSFP